MYRMNCLHMKRLVASGATRLPRKCHCGPLGPSSVLTRRHGLGKSSSSPVVWSTFSLTTKNLSTDTPQQQQQQQQQQRSLSTSSVLVGALLATTAAGIRFVAITSNESPRSMSSSSSSSTTNPSTTTTTTKSSEQVPSQQQSIFDIASDWVQQDGENFLQKFILQKEQDVKKSSSNSNNNEAKQQQPIQDSHSLSFWLDKFKNPFGSSDYPSSPPEPSNTTTNVSSSSSSSSSSSNDSDSITSLGKSVSSFLVSAIGNGNTFWKKEEGDDTMVRNLIQKALSNETSSNTSSSPDQIQEAKSYTDILTLFREVHSTLDQTFGDLDFTKVDPLSMFYYLEYEDERKTPSWKRRMHRYHPSVDVRTVNELNDFLTLSSLAYGANTAKAVQQGLSEQNYELVYYQAISEPGKPSHFVALKKNQSSWKYTPLEILLVVRGTQTFDDAITDALMVPSSYRNGLAHDGLVRSGQYLVETHTPLFKKLLKLSGKKRVRLHITGHSLGAAAAAIAGMEFHDYGNVDVRVVGFGCPALLSQELSEQCKDYVTTVINDSDVIPRTSGVTLANVAMDIMEHDWTDQGRRDVRQALEEVQSRVSSSSWMDVDSFMDIVDKTFLAHTTTTTNDSSSTTTTKDTSPSSIQPPQPRMKPVLFPPGTCIHFYRDGSSISGSVAPCTFFHEIDVTRTMIDDHRPHAYQKLFLQLMRDYHQDDHFSFGRIHKNAATYNK